MKYKRIYDGVDSEMLNTIDRNMHEAGENYWKLGPRRRFPRKFRACYVNVMVECDITGDQKKKIMGPYSKKTADLIMTDFLLAGKCCWVEEDWIR